MEYFVKSIRYFGTILCICLISVDCALVEYVEESCYSQSFPQNFLQPNCSSGEVIYPYDIYTYAKKIESSCFDITTLVVENSTYCCNYVNETEDCGMRYFGVSSLEHYRQYSGKEKGALQTAWNDTSRNCNHSVYYSKTHYMRLTYNCIQTSQIGSVCNASLSGNPLFLWNDGYPHSGGDCSSTSGCTCVVMATGGSSIQIDALDLRFKVNSSSGYCSQRLHIKDGSMESDIACDDENLFERRTMYTSVSSSIEIRYDNSYGEPDGNFWISIQAIDSSQTLTVTCGQAGSTVLVYDCGDNFTIISPRTTQPPDTTTDLNTSPTSETTTVSSVTTGVTTTESSSNTDSSTTSQTSTSGIYNISTGTSGIYNISTGTSGIYNISTGTSGVTDLSSTTLTHIPPTSKSTGAESTSSKGPIIGIIIGVVIASVVAGLIGYSIWRRKMKASYQVNPEQEYEEYFGNSDGAITSRPPGLERMATRFE